MFTLKYVDPEVLAATAARIYGGGTAILGSGLLRHGEVTVERST